MRKTLLVILAMALVPCCALAVDGQVLINQSTVTAEGGFPYVISQPGSYKLSGNLSVSSTTSSAIRIKANFVTIDLNGFSIIGPGSGTAYGIEAYNPQAPDATPTHVTVVNGAITGFGGSSGIFSGGGAMFLGAHARVQNTHVSNDFFGIIVGLGSLVIGNIVETSGGIIFDLGSIVRDNTVTVGGGIGGNCPAVIVGNAANIGVNNASSCTMSQNVPVP
jgi:hypothetical protein